MMLYILLWKVPAKMTESTRKRKALRIQPHKFYTMFGALRKVDGVLVLSL